MEPREIRVWYDPEGDFLEVTFEKREGYFRATQHDRVMERVDADGRVIGFSVLGVKTLQPTPIDVGL